MNRTSFSLAFLEALIWERRCDLQISTHTKDVFIECTATDLAKAKIVLNTVCTMFSQYCGTAFEVEPVEVVDAFGISHGKLKSLNYKSCQLICNSKSKEPFCQSAVRNYKLRST